MPRSYRILVTLPKFYKDFLDDMVRTGSHSSKSEVIRMALLMYHEELYKLKTIQKLGMEEG